MMEQGRVGKPERKELRYKNYVKEDCIRDRMAGYERGNFDDSRCPVYMWHRAGYHGKTELVLIFQCSWNML